MLAPDPISGQDTDLLTRLFLNAPIPNLPRPRRLFQKEDVNVTKAGVSYQQFVDCYHGLANTIEAGFGNNSIFSPSAWIRTMSDLISGMPQGTLAMRNFGPDGEPLDQDDFKNSRRGRLGGNQKKNLTNLEQQSSIFPSPYTVNMCFIFFLVVPAHSQNTDKTPCPPTFFCARRTIPYRDIKSSYSCITSHASQYCTMYPMCDGGINL
jgi:hypothetical protein